MDAPAGFRKSLAEQSLGKLRIRWSHQFNEWHIEEKISNPMNPLGHVDEYDDRGVRFKDGYSLLMRIRTGDRVQCLGCKSDVKLIAGSKTETKCGVCGKGTLAFFFPLSDMLLEYLRKIDPKRGGYERLMAELKEGDGKEARDKAKLSDEIQLGAREEFRYMTGQPMVGYTGG